MKVQKCNPGGFSFDDAIQDAAFSDAANGSKGTENQKYNYARYKMLSYFAKEQDREEVLGDILTDNGVVSDYAMRACSGSSPEHALELRDMDAALTSRQQKIIQLLFIEDVDADEAARRLGISRSTMDRDMAYAREVLGLCGPRSCFDFPNLNIAPEVCELDRISGKGSAGDFDLSTSVDAFIRRSIAGKRARQREKSERIRSGWHVLRAVEPGIGVRRCLAMTLTCSPSGIVYLIIRLGEKRRISVATMSGILSETVVPVEVAAQQISDYSREDLRRMLMACKQKLSAYLGDSAAMMDAALSVEALCSVVIKRNRLDDLKTIASGESIAPTVPSAPVDASGLFRHKKLGIVDIVQQLLDGRVCVIVRQTGKKVVTQAKWIEPCVKKETRRERRARISAESKENTARALAELDEAKTKAA